MNTIYKLTSPSGKSYIGKTQSILSDRISKHISSAKAGSNYTIHKAIRKYGFDKFDVEILYQGTYMVNINHAEIYFIKEHDAFKNGYNSTKGGEGQKGIKRTEEQKKRMSEIKKGTKCSEDTKKKMSIAHTGRSITWKEKIRQSNLGLTRTEETRKRISEAKKGTKHSEEHKRKIGLASKGRKGYWTGKNLSEETKKKMSIAHKLYWKNKKET